jgi:excisionase family DNA binding protein
MTDSLIIDDLTYISIREAAIASHLSTEYLSRLARQHRLRARMVGRMWFIEPESLQQFLSTRPAQKA